MSPIVCIFGEIISPPTKSYRGSESLVSRISLSSPQQSLQRPHSSFQDFLLLINYLTGDPDFCA